MDVVLSGLCESSSVDRDSSVQWPRIHQISTKYTSYAEMVFDSPAHARDWADWLVDVLCDVGIEAEGGELNGIGYMLDQFVGEVYMASMQGEAE